MPWDDTSGRTGLDPWAMQSQAEAEQRVRDVESRHAAAGGSAADARSLRSWLPLLAILVGVFLVLLILSLPR
jgi:hypothetical protein